MLVEYEHHGIEEVEAALVRHQGRFEQGTSTVNDVAERFREFVVQKRTLKEESAEKSATKVFPAE